MGGCAAKAASWLDRAAKETAPRERVSHAAAWLGCVARAAVWAVLTRERKRPPEITADPILFLQPAQTQQRKRPASLAKFKCFSNALACMRIGQAPACAGCTCTRTRGDAWDLQS
eukprot:363738-Chlamydomonas_euryale.AAC.6